MCGIIGLNEKNEKLIRSASELFSYRGPDSSNYYSDSSMSLGHHRLSIIDTDSRSDQPFWDDEHRVGVVFNGEIYNFADLKKDLSKKYNFRTTSDTEVLVYGYLEWGVSLIEKLDGMFAFAIYDTLRKKIIMARDHMGIKPLYYYAKNDLLIFASEVKGVTKILRGKNIPLKINQNSIELYFAFGYVPSPHTIYDGINKVAKSSYIDYDLESNKFEIVKYSPNTKNINEENDYIKLIEDKTIAHLVSDVPVGVFFSGGTDSSLISSILQKNKINLENFSIEIDYKSDDKFYFKKISDYLSIKSNNFHFGLAEMDGIYEEVMSRVDEPFYDNSIFPTYFVSKKAAEKVKVVLSGEGGDEFFYGYPRSLILSRLTKKIDYSVSLLDLIYLYLPTFKSKNYLFEKLFVLFKQPISYYLVCMSPSRDLMGIKSWRIAKEEFRKRNLKPMQFDQEFYLENDLLRKTDLATSYASIEGRVPLLDIDIVNSSFLFESQKLDNGVLKAFLKKILTKYLPQELVYRSKSGFGINIVEMFNGSVNLKNDLNSAINYLDSRGIISGFNKNSHLGRYPHMAFAIIMLFRAIKNNEES